MLDRFLFEQLNGLAMRWDLLDSFASFTAEYLGYVLIFGIFLFLFSDFKKYAALPVLAIVSAVLSRFVFTEIIRFLFFRPRPFVVHEIIPLIEHDPTASFPSGHASFFFALSAIVFLYDKKSGYLFFIISFLIGLSRIISGIHWPSDILGGALVGIFSACIVWRGWKKYNSYIKKES